MGISPDQYHEMLQRLAPKVKHDFSEGVDDESQLQMDIEQECRRRGWIPLRSRMDRKTARKKGEWDFTIVANGGRTIFVECKSKTGKLSPDQQAMIAHARILGHAVHVVCSMEEFLGIL